MKPAEMPQLVPQSWTNFKKRISQNLKNLDHILTTKHIFKAILDFPILWYKDKKIPKPIDFTTVPAYHNFSERWGIRTPDNLIKSQVLHEKYTYTACKNM